MTIQQALQLARIKLLEQTSEVVSDETLLLYANLTNIDLVKRTFTNDKILSATVNLTNGVGALPSGFGTMYGSAQDSAENTYEEVSIEDFDNKTLDRMMTIEGGNLKVYPKTVASVAIKYYPTFSTLTVASTPPVNEYFHECIVYGILERAFEDLQDETLSAYYKAKYESEVARRSATQSNYEEANSRGGQMFSYQKLI